MLEGITILSTEIRIASTSWAWAKIGTLAIILGAIFFILCAIFFSSNSAFGFLGCAIGIISILFGAASNFSQNPIMETVYSVTVDDNVSINEFMEMYEIIEQDGLIYKITVKE